MDLVVAPTRAGLRVTDPDRGSDLELDWPSAAEWVRDRERGGDIRWVWPDTASLAPHLLAAGVRVARCHDLRLCHTILHHATADPWPPPAWLVPAPVEPAAPSLLDDLTPDHAPTIAEVSAEHDRQLQALAEAPDPRRLRLLLAAESAGALIAAEMHADGLPWDRARHDQILRQALGPQTHWRRWPHRSGSCCTSRTSTPTPRRACSRRCATPVWICTAQPSGSWSASPTRSSSRCLTTSASPGCCPPTGGPGWTPG